MSIGYSIDAKLQVSFSDNSIKAILQRGMHLGFIYRKYIWGELNMDSSPLSVDDAMKTIHKTKEVEDFYCIAIEFEGVYLSMLFFKEENGTLGVTLTGLNCLLARTYENQEKEDIDVARYVRIMLEITQDYYISDLLVEQDKWIFE